MAETAVVTRSKIDIKPPALYKVVVCNDDVTPMEFVVKMLMKTFKHSEQSAVDLTLKIHNEGSAVAGVYTYEIAEQKGIEATLSARQEGFPLVIKVEPE